MNLWESISIALDTLRAHKLRSFLTLLGIIVSVWTLVAVVALVQGVNGYVSDKVARLGSNTFSVQQMPLRLVDVQAYNEAKKRNKPIRMEEFNFLQSHAALPTAIAASARHNSLNVKAGDQSLDQVTIEGDTPEAIHMAAYDVAEGRFITPEDEQHRAAVAFIGPDIAKHLFAGLDPIGKHLTVDGSDYTVIGVATVLGNTFGQSQDNYVVLPLSSYRKQYGTHDSLNIEVQAASALKLPATEDEVRMLMRAYRHLGYSKPDTFGIITASAVMDLFHNITGIIAAVMVGVSSVFLVVGGIVIMNIMLAAVTERTREIGIRKALGARRADILRQFLVESAVLAIAGGLLGILIAWLFTLAAGAVTPIPFSMPVSAVFLAVTISAAVGIFFGMYPANKAAKLEPITALRAEV